MMRLKGLRTISELILSSSLYVVLPVFIMVVLLMSGCMKTDSGKISEGAEMQFTVGSTPSTKTAYTQEDESLQLIWVKDDQVSIFCDQAGGDSGEPGPGKTKADYDVTPQSDPTRGILSKAASEKEKGLRWGSNGEHNIYAVYPSIGNSKDYVKKVVKADNDGFFTFDFPKTQYCGTDGEYVLGTKHRLQPQMYLAYMMANRKRLTPTNNTVELKFKPIATTLEITLQGAVQGDVEISGLQLSVKNIAGQYVMDNSGKSTYQIQFDATKDFSIDVSNSLTAYTSGSITTANFTLKLSGGGNYTLKAGESVTFTVFLPPIKNLKDVDVTCLDGNGVSLGTKVILTTAVANPASKSFIKMPQIGPDSIKVLPENSTNLVATYTSGDIVLKYGLTQQLKAIAYFKDGSTRDITLEAGTAWSYEGTVEGADKTAGTASVNDTDNKGLVTLIKVGTSKITATFQGVSDTANVKPQIYRTFKANDYYQWDAYLPYEQNNVKANNPDHFGYNNWGTSSSCGHFGNNVVATTPLFKKVFSVNQVAEYLGNGMFFSVTDGLICTSELFDDNGILSCSGIWLKKRGSSDWKNGVKVTTIPVTDAITHRPEASEIDKYFFIPKAGTFHRGRRYQLVPYSRFHAIQMFLSTPVAGNFNHAYCLCGPLSGYDRFEIGWTYTPPGNSPSNYIDYGWRSGGYIPFSYDFDPTYQ